MTVLHSAGKMQYPFAYPVPCLVWRRFLSEIYLRINKEFAACGSRRMEVKLGSFNYFICADFWPGGHLP